MNEFIEGLIILSVLLLPILVLLFKWWKDYKRTGKILVLYDKKRKYLSLILIIILILLIIIIFTTDYSESIQNFKEKWNANGWHV